MPYNDNMTGGYGPRPNYGPGSDDYQLGQIKTGFQDAQSRYNAALSSYKTAKTDEQRIQFEEESEKAYNDMLHFKDRYDYMQTPTTHQRPERISGRAGRASDYMITPLTQEERRSYLGATGGSRMFGGSQHRRRQLEERRQAYQFGGMRGLQEYLREERTRLTGL